MLGFIETLANHPYTGKNMNITCEVLKQINDVEIAFGTTKLLPSQEEIPKEFYTGNDYSKFVDAYFYGRELPTGSIEFKPGFSMDSMPDVRRVLTSHLRSFEPKHEHKLAGVAFLLSQIMTIELK